MSHKAVFRVQPMTSKSLSGASKHQLRTTAETHIDPARTKHNRVVFGSGDLVQDIKQGSEGIPLASKRTTIIAAEAVMTANQTYFDEICPKWREGEINPAMQKWIDKSMEWIQKNCPGKVVAADLHLDEQAPHLHVFIVPVTEYEQKFRHGSKQVEKINYRKCFSDNVQTLKKARTDERSDLDTKLGRLQTDYGDFMKPCGLERGIRNSRAKHKKIRQHQRQIQEPIPAEKDIDWSIPKPPGLIDRASEAKVLEYGKACALKGFEAGKSAMEERVSAVWSKAKNHDNLAKDKERLTDRATIKDTQIADLRNQVSKLDLTVSRQKAEIDKLRAVPMESVCKELEYNGPVRWKNAIDLLKDLAKFDFKESVAWLADRFSKDQAVATAMERTKINAEKAIETTQPPLTEVEMRHEQKRLADEQLARDKEREAEISRLARQAEMEKQAKERAARPPVQSIKPRGMSR